MALQEFTPRTLDINNIGIAPNLEMANAQARAKTAEGRGGTVEGSSGGSAAGHRGEVVMFATGALKGEAGNAVAI